MGDITNTEQGADFSNKKILIVEDTKSNYMLLFAILKPTNAEILWASNGETAIEYCKNNDIDLVLMDIMLPDMSGCEITRTIKTFKKDLPVIAQTAYAMAGDRERCIEAGCDDYLAKPITGYALISTIQRYIGNRG
jgi:two-component system, cell cycle response regulator DivK